MFKTVLRQKYLILDMVFYSVCQVPTYIKLEPKHLNPKYLEPNTNLWRLSRSAKSFGSCIRGLSKLPIVMEKGGKQNFIYVSNKLPTEDHPQKEKLSTKKHENLWLEIWIFF